MRLFLFLYLVLSLVMSIRALNLPKLIVFDLDATLWTPELYTLRRLARAKETPKAGVDVKLFPDVLPTLTEFANSNPEVKLAVASRTDKGAWARDLLKQFSIPVDDRLIEIYTGTKTQHFSALAEKTKLPFSSMLFFDDARDGKFGNCEHVANMGVLSAYCPKPHGLTKAVFDNALDRYSKGDRGMIIDPITTKHGARTGVVKNYDPVKRYGFVSVPDEKDIFFHESAIEGFVVSNGDKVEIDVGMNRGKVAALSVRLLPSSSTSSSSSTTTITLPCFSMSQPFAAFLANGIKTIGETFWTRVRTLRCNTQAFSPHTILFATRLRLVVESRNHDMLKKLPPNSDVLLHINQKIYPDGGEHKKILAEAGIDDVESAGEIRVGGPGEICAILKVGETKLTTLEEVSEREEITCPARYNKKIDASLFAPRPTCFAHCRGRHQWSNVAWWLEVRLLESIKRRLYKLRI